MNIPATSSRSLSRSTAAIRRPAPAHIIQSRRRSLHESRIRNAIMMPAMSPLMTEGAITQWLKKEGDFFEAGDVLLQIESDIATIDVEAQNAGIIGKILMPDGTKNIPVEQVIAIVAKNGEELSQLQMQSPNIPTTPTPKTPFTSTPLPRTPFTPLIQPQTPFTPTIIAPYSPIPHTPSTPVYTPSPITRPSLSSSSPYSHTHIPAPPVPLFHHRSVLDTDYQENTHTLSGGVRGMVTNSARSAVDSTGDQQPPDAASIRRMIVSNLSQTQTKSPSFPLPTHRSKKKCSTTAYFDGLL